MGTRFRDFDDEDYNEFRSKKSKDKELRDKRREKHAPPVEETDRKRQKPSRWSNDNDD